MPDNFERYQSAINEDDNDIKPNINGNGPDENNNGFLGELLTKDDKYKNLKVDDWKNLPDEVKELFNK